MLLAEEGHPEEIDMIHGEAARQRVIWLQFKWFGKNDFIPIFPSKVVRVFNAPLDVIGKDHKPDAGLSFPDIPDGTPVITRRECGKKITVLEVIPPPDVD